MSSGAAPKRLWPDRPHGQRISISLSRAFMPWPGVLELVKGNLNPNGVIVLLLRERLQESPDWEQAAQNWRIAGQYTYTASRTQRYLYALTAQDAL